LRTRARRRGHGDQRDEHAADGNCQGILSCDRAIVR
jgi:hypothetical protein